MTYRRNYSKITMPLYVGDNGQINTDLTICQYELIDTLVLV